MSLKIRMLLALLVSFAVILFLGPAGKGAGILCLSVFTAGAVLSNKAPGGGEPLRFMKKGSDRWLSRQGNFKLFGFYDKAEHAFLYVPLTFFLMACMYNFDLSLAREWVVSSSLLAVTLGIIKEIWDGTVWAMNLDSGNILKGNGFSSKDLAANLIGISVFIALYIALKALYA